MPKHVWRPRRGDGGDVRAQDTGGARAAEEKFCALGPCVAFLRRHSMQGYQEVLDKYVESMRAGLGAQLRHIEREVSRHQVEVLKHGDTLFTPGGC
eukprot:2038780-Rhodomonas_salina.1